MNRPMYQNVPQSTGRSVFRSKKRFQLSRYRKKTGALTTAQAASAATKA
jgi:hypothetical protein